MRSSSSYYINMPNANFFSIGEQCQLLGRSLFSCHPVRMKAAGVLLAII